MQSHEASRLRGHAVSGHQLLLLADGAEEAERVRAKTDQSEGREQRQAQPGAHRHSQALARA
jgi:hypothetical protein